MTSTKIVIVDYGMGNLGSIRNMLKYLDVESSISNDSEDIRKADKLIISGVGAFDNGMDNLEKLGLIPLLTEKVLEEKIHVLGICLGMQLFTKGSEEGKKPGLGWINGETVRFRFSPGVNRLKVPHMGWNLVAMTKESKLNRGINNNPRFYFVHSYHVKCKDSGDVLYTTHYGYDFDSAIERGNIFGVQFHPEKSHKFGMNILKNFVELN